MQQTPKTTTLEGRRLTVADLMSAEVFTCGPDDSLGHAAGLLLTHDCGCVVVVGADRRVLGTVTDRDGFVAALTEGGLLERMPVTTAMTRPATCSPRDELDAASALLRDAPAHRLPVIDSAGRLVGILSGRSLARCAA